MKSDRAVLFSCPQPLNAPGPSRPLTRLHNAFQAHFQASHTLWPQLFPQMADPGKLGEALGPAFDDVATDRLTDAGSTMAPNVFLGGGGASLHQMEWAHALAGASCGTLWFSSHYEHATKVLATEYAAHGIQSTPIHPYVAWRAKQEQLASDFLVVPSEACKATYPAALQHKIHVAQFGVDTERYRPRPKRQNPRLQVLFPGTNPFRKGLRYALQAWKTLDHAKYQLTVTGTQLAPLPPNMPPVLSTGWVPDPAMDDLYASHDVLLLPSLEEGQALASLEAAACGLPLIVTPETGLPITDGKEGFVVPARDPAAIQHALETLQDPDVYHRMSHAARVFAEARPWSFFTDRVISILEA